MAGSSLEVIREVRRLLRDWLETVQKSPDPASRHSGELQKISEELKRVDAALREASPALVNSEEWKRETAAYAETLRELRARLGNFEITLRIRSLQIANKQAHMSAVRCWADLARQIG